MHRFDPRELSLRAPRSTLGVLLVLSLVFAWGNTRVKKGGILDEGVIVNEADPYRLMDRYVRDKERDGFHGRELVSFFLHEPLQSVGQLQEVLRFTEAVKAAFGPGVFSLSEAPAYYDNGETLSDDPYIRADDVARRDFDLDAWRRRVTADPAAFGLLVGRDFSWSAVVRFLPPGYDEVTEFRRTVEFLEERTIPSWEWQWKTDIAPRRQDVGVGGWVMGRGLIDQAVNVDMLNLVNLGVALTLPVFWLALGSWRRAALAVVGMIGLGFVWTRGTMGLLGMPERIFSLLAYANVIVQGTSFALHKFSALGEGDAADRVAAWRQARSVDVLIATTAAIAIFGFATLWSFGVRPIRELGVASAMGVLWIFVLAVVFLPAMDLVLGTPSGVDTGLRRRGAARRFERTVERLVDKCLQLALWLSTGRRPWGAIALVCGLFAAAATLFAQGRITTRTRALPFIHGTAVEREARFLNQPGNVGFEFLDLLIEPNGPGNGIRDAVFLRRAWDFQAALKTVAGARETMSVLSSVHQIARESLKKPLPETPQEVGAAFFLIENRLSPAMLRQLYYLGGLRMSVSYGIDDSIELGRFCDDVFSLARNRFPDLKVSAFNKAPLSQRVDKYVREGKVYNVFTSQIGVAVICGVLILWQNRRRRRARLSALRGGLVMSVPLFFATAVIGIVMWVLDIPLDVSTASIGALTINAATDFSLYLAMTYHAALDEWSPREALVRALSQQGPIIVQDCILNSLCFLPLAASHFLPVRQAGWMMGVMLLVCAVGTLVFAAALLPRCVAQQSPVAQ